MLDPQIANYACSGLWLCIYYKIVTYSDYIFFDREVFDIPLDRLPSYTEGGDNSLCDICIKKGSDSKPAVAYCTSCTKKYCVKHKEVGTCILS